MLQFITSNRKNIEILSWRVTALDDQQNRFAILRRYLRSSLRVRMLRSTYRKKKSNLPTAGWREYVSKSDNAPCSYDTAVTMFKAIMEKNNSRCKFIGDAAILERPDLHPSRTCAISFPTFADICAVIHITKEQRRQGALRITMSSVITQGVSVSCIVGKEVKFVREDGQSESCSMLGRSCAQHLPPEEMIPVIIKKPDTINTQGGFRTDVRFVPAGSIEYEDPDSTYDFLLKWTRMDTNTRDFEVAAGVMGTIQVHVPQLAVRSTVVGEEIKYKMETKPAMMAPVVHSEYEGIFAEFPKNGSA